MRVFRIEHKYDGIGPYRNKLMDIDYSFSDRHPNPVKDILENLSLEKAKKYQKALDLNKVRFAFKNIKYLNKWFRDEMKELIKQDFVIREYSVPIKDIFKGKKQLAFILDNATRINTIQLELNH